MECPFCKIPANFLYKINKFDESMNIFICPNCKLQMQNIDDPYKFYTKEYFEGIANYNYFDERKYYKYCEYVWQARLKTIKKFKPPPARLLDIGCSFGGFIKTAINFGYNVEGIDISSYAIDECKKDPILKDKVHCSNILYFNPSTKYDIITLIEVLEHLPEPGKVFKKLYDLLNPSGLLIIQTANFDGLQAKIQKDQYHYYLPGHLYYYSRSNLTKHLKNIGFNQFIYFHGVDFGLLPKLKKMKGFIQGPAYYYKCIKTSIYHFLSKIAIRNFAMTSSFVLYAFK